MSFKKTSNALLFASIVLIATSCASMFKDGPLIDKPEEKTGTLTFINNTNDEVRNVMIVRCSARSFLSSRNEKPVPPNDKQVFEVSPGCWSMRIDGHKKKFTGDVQVTSGQNTSINLDGNLR